MPEPFVAPRRKTLELAAAFALITIATCIADAPIFGNRFVNWDDQDTLYRNPDFNPPALSKLATYWSRPHGRIYIPVTYTFWWGLTEMSWTAAGLQPAVFHAASVALHVAAACLAMVILLRLTDNLPASCAGALLFALHPVQVEAVAWASGAKDLLAGAMSLAAIALCLRRRRAVTPRTRRLWIAAATLAFMLAMLAKPSAIVVPLMALPIEWLIDRKLPRDMLMIAGAWLLLTVPTVLIAHRSQPAEKWTPPAVWKGPLVAADSVGFYLKQVIFPRRMAIDYGRSPDVALRSPWGNVILAAALAAAAVLLLRRTPVLAAGLLIALAALMPYLGMISFDFQINSTVTDHYLYLAMLGPAVVVAYFLRDAAKPMWVVAGAILLALAIGSFRQARTWRDSSTLFAHALDVNPDSFVAHHTLGFLLAERGDFGDAETEYHAALRLRPGDAEANFNLANLLSAQNRVPDALEYYQRALEAAPRDTRKINNFAIALARLGRSKEAEALLRSALQLDGACADLLHANLGNLLLSQGHREAAQEEFLRALELDPNSSVARNGLARIAATQK